MPITEQPELSIIFVNYRSASVLKRAILSLRSGDISSFKIEIIVVNNDSDEKTRVRKLSEELGFRALFLAENRGFAHAANTAATVATGKIVGFLNPDTEFVSGSFVRACRFFQSNPEVGIVGARLITKTGEPEAWSAGPTLSLFRLFRNNIGLSSGRWHSRSRCARAVGWVSGGALFIRLALFRSLEGFDEAYFLYFEDMDLCMRARAVGLKTVTFPSLVFKHDGGTSFQSVAEKKKAYYDSQDRYFGIHRPSAELFLLRLIRSRMTNI
ncbi:MAG: glycosyltransferase [Candidatus Moranbacteria bacterium]|nr:glycosyltransferase [Candidatus Moranbacteria bacterium]NTW75345.1 glycosyltransferase [Candidatus Moranbacteria bacterium]